MIHTAVQKQGPVPMEQLQVSGGIASIDVKKLENVGLFAIKSVAISPRKDLLQIKGISEASVDKSIDAAVPLGFILASKLPERLETSNLVPMGFISARQLLAERIKKSKLVPLGFITASELFAQRLQDTTSESTEFDKILEGGIATGSVTEIYGEIRSGKGQLCHPLCSTSQLPLDEGGGEGKAMYTDAEGTFRPQRDLQKVERSVLHSADTTGLEMFPCQSTKGMSYAVSPTSATDLPKDIWSEILLRAALPVRTLVNLTSNKFWNSIITDPWFVKEHDKRGETTNILLVQEVDRSNFTLYLLETHTRDVRIRFPDNVFEGNQFDVVASCRGLLCMTNLSDANGRILLWNPSIQRVREVGIPQGQNEEDERAPTAYGLGLHTESNEYQILRICCVSPPESENPVYQVQIFSLASNGWSTLDHFLGHDWPVRFSNAFGVYVDGYIYWTLENKSKREVLRYDLVNASFQILAPVPVVENSTQWIAGACTNFLGLLIRKDTRLGTVEVYELMRNEEWELFYMIGNVSVPLTVMARPLSRTRYGYNTGVFDEGTSDFHFTFFQASEELVDVKDIPSDIVVLPGADSHIFVDEYRETLQLL